MFVFNLEQNKTWLKHMDETHVNYFFSDMKC